MKRIALLFSLLLLCSGCNAPTPTATDLLAKLLAYPDIPAVTVYFQGALAGETGYLSGEEFRRLYGGQDPARLSDEYAIALGKDDSIYEIHLFHALDAEKAEAIEANLRYRQALLWKQDTAFYDPDNPAAGSIIWKRGKWVCLLVTNDNERAVEVLKNAL